MVKNPAARDLGSIPGWEDLQEKGMATHSTILTWRIPWTKEPSRLWSMGSQRVGHDWATNSCTFCLRHLCELEILALPLFCELKLGTSSFSLPLYNQCASFYVVSLSKELLKQLKWAKRSKVRSSTKSDFTSVLCLHMINAQLDTIHSCNLWFRICVSK